MHRTASTGRASPPPPYRLSPSPDPSAEAQPEPPSRLPPGPAEPLRSPQHHQQSGTVDSHDGPIFGHQQPSRPSPAVGTVAETCNRDENAGDAGPSTRAHRDHINRLATTASLRPDGQAGSERQSPSGDQSRQSLRASSLSPVTRAAPSDFQAPSADPEPARSDLGVGEPSFPAAGVVPDFAVGRGGDNIGANRPTNVPTSGESLERQEGPVDDGMAEEETRKAMMKTLDNILSCTHCPLRNGRRPPLHLPVTLPCGHTLSSTHLTFPPTPSLPPPIDPSDHVELTAAQQRRHQQKLSLWAGVSCVIPGCKRNSSGQTTAEDAPQGAQSGSRGVALFPSLPLPLPSSRPASRASALSLNLGPDVLPPAYSSIDDYNQDITTGPPLLDTRISKILDMVKAEKSRLYSIESRNTRETPSHWSDTSPSSDDESDVHRTRTSSAISSSSAHRTTKRPRRRLGLPSPTLPLAAPTQDNWQFKKDLMLTLECDVCAQLLYQPATTPCQHSFCTKCLSRSLDHSPRCPVCRQDLPSFTFFQDHPQTKVLVSVLTAVFPDEYNERQTSFENEERDSLLTTPIFVCTLAFPGMPTILHVFEPRYRLMIRRCIESDSPRFGMILPARGTGPENLQGVMEYGTMLEIQSVQMLPDGRSIVETVGTNRFKLLEKGSLDGYTVGRIDIMEDVTPEEDAEMKQEAVRRKASASSRQSSSAPTSPPRPAPPVLHSQPMEVSRSAPGSSNLDSNLTPNPNPRNGLLGPPTADTISLAGPFGPPGNGGMGMPPPGSAGLPGQISLSGSAEDTPESIDELMAICRSFIDQLRSGSAPWLLQRLNNTYGTMPEDPSEFGYWMALVMPIDEYEKARLLPIRSPRLRLKLIVFWIQSLRSSWWFSNGCVVG